MGKAQSLRGLALVLIIPVLLGFLSLFGAAEAARSGPLDLEIVPLKSIYSAREGLSVRFRFTARERTKLCLSKDLLSQMQVNVYRSGRGKIAMQPLVSRDNQVVFEETMKVRWLEPGQSIDLKANLKRLQFAEGQKWTPGEYSVRAAFSLCEQTPTEEVPDIGRETLIPARKPGWFMIMN